MPDQKDKALNLRDSVLTTAGVAALLFGARYASDILVPFLLALFIVIIAIGPIDWLKKRGLPSVLAVGTVIMVVIGLIVLIAVMLGSTIEQFNKALPGYQARLTEITQGAIAWLGSHGVDVSKAGIQKVLNPGLALSFVNTILGSLAGIMSNALLIIFTVLMMLVEAEGFPRKVLLMKGGSGDITTKRLSQIMESMNRYVGAKALISLMTGVLVWIGLSLVGLDFAILWAFLAFVLNFIPNI